MRLLFGLFAFLIILHSGCIDPLIKQVETNDTEYSERFRPQFHFSPKSNWMNDPNGLIFENDRYHLFYQFYPDSTVWGPMHWGHATSEDLTHWTHQPIALYPDSLGYIFSGSAVMDYKNSSGLGSENQPALVAIYTYHNMEYERSGRNDYQTQGIAFSLDHGMTWEKYDGNPVIKNPGIKDFRDPKVFWHEPTQKWILILVAGDHARIYNSKNLIDWTFLSDFGHNEGAHGGVWECPDLFPLTTDQGDQKWVLIISINPGGPQGGSATQYFVGDFDGQKFTTAQKESKWLDFGRDNYAGVTYNDAPEGKRILMGWMSNWDYAQVTPTTNWRSAMTLPRSLELKGSNSDYYLVQNPIIEPSIIARTEEFDVAQVTEGVVLPSSQFQMEFEVDLSEKTVFELANEQDQFVFSIDPTLRQMMVDRRFSGKIEFSDKFAPGQQISAFIPESRAAKVTIFSDASSIEIFVDQGRYVFTNQVFPEQPYSHLRIVSDGVKTYKIIFSELNSIWHEQ